MSASTNGHLRLHIFNQSEPYRDNWGADVGRPRYFSDTVYYQAASLLGGKAESHPVGFARNNVSQTLRLSMKALKAIMKLDDGLAVIWQGYGVYAVLANSVYGKGKPYLLNTYKVPVNGPRPLKTKVNDRLLSQAIESAAGVIVITKSQASSLNANGANALWVPFASDADWWTRALPNHEFLAANGVEYRDYVLVVGDVFREEETTLKAVKALGHPILRVTRSPQTAAAAQEAFSAVNITRGSILVNVSFELLREIYRGARAVIVAAKSDLYPSGMTSLTEAMSCGRPVIIPAGLTTEGYVQDGYDAFVTDEWEAPAIADRVARIYETDLGETIGRNARNTVEERLNFHASAKKLADFITRLGTDSPAKNDVDEKEFCERSDAFKVAPLV